MPGHHNVTKSHPPSHLRVALLLHQSLRFSTRRLHPPNDFQIPVREGNPITVPHRFNELVASPRRQPLKHHRLRLRNARNQEELAKFRENDIVCVAREDFHSGEKLCLPWRRLRRVAKCLHDYEFQMGILRNSQLQTVHSTCVKFWSDEFLDTAAIIPHVLSSETGMPV